MNGLRATPETQTSGGSSARPAERRRELLEFRQRASALSENAARWALIHLIEDLEPLGIPRECIETALAVVEPGGAWEGGL